ncbi:MAG: PEP-CTERM sorting domain-containing protein [Planctomycetaceae bacterium]|nr:PEP-CTERM sorting domain-containing protein [Planctomycetaceae bacterium]
MHLNFRCLCLFGLALIGAGAQPAHSAAVISGAAADAVGITAARDAFRVTLGGGNVAGANGLFSDATGSRREINWDGVPDARSAPNNLPADFFNVNSPRGAVFSTAGTGFQVSAKAGVAPIEFGSIDPSYVDAFQAFSAQRIFTPLDSNVMDVNFFLPGTSTNAVTSGFGIVFSDVDLANTTSIELFDNTNASLGTFFVPALAGDATFSFLGISFHEAIIARAHITLGNAALGLGVTDQNGSGRDLVTQDDYLYGSPVLATPEPSTIVMLAFGSVTIGLVALRRRSKARRA